MSDAQKVKRQAKRARVSLEIFCEYVKAKGANIDVAEEADKIRRQLNGERPKRASQFIARSVIVVADLFRREPRPQELVRNKA
jgi:hypothetical protein